MKQLFAKELHPKTGYNELFRVFEPDSLYKIESKFGRMWIPAIWYMVGIGGKSVVNDKIKSILKR